MPIKPDSHADLHLVGLTTDGRLWHTMRRRDDGGWKWLPKFEDSTIAQAGTPGDFIDVDCARQVANADQPSALHVVGVTADGRLWWASRNSQTGRWNRFQNVETSGAGEAGTFVRAAVSVSHAWPGEPDGQPTKVEIHLAGLTGDGRLLVTSRTTTPTAATFSRFTNVELTGGGERGDFRAVALAGITGRDNAPRSHLCAVTGNGRLWHSIGRPGSGPGAWEPLRDVERDGQAGDFGDLVEVGCADDLHVGAVSGDGRVGYTFRNPDDSAVWPRFRDLESAGDVGTFTRISAAKSSSRLHFSGVTSDGQLWHMIGKDLTSRFGDVEEGGAGEVGTFQTVGVA